MDRNIEQEISDKAKHILKAKENLDLLQIEQYRKKKELLELTENVRKEKSIISRLVTEKEILTREFWSQKDRI